MNLIVATYGNDCPVVYPATVENALAVFASVEAYVPDRVKRLTPEVLSAGYVTDEGVTRMIKKIIEGDLGCVAATLKSGGEIVVTETMRTGVITYLFYHDMNVHNFSVHVIDKDPSIWDVPGLEYFKTIPMFWRHEVSMAKKYCTVKNDSFVPLTKDFEDLKKIKYIVDAANDYVGRDGRFHVVSVGQHPLTS